MKRLAWGLIMAAGLAACGDDTGGSGGGSGSGGSDAASTTAAQTTSDAATSTASSSSASGGGGSADYSELYLCEETDFEDDIALSGPGFDPETGITGEPQKTYLVAATQIYLRADKLDEFGAAAGAVVETLGGSEGMLAFGIGSSQTCGLARTVSIWSSEEAMLSFVVSDAHASAMLQAPDISLTGRTTHWEATADELLELDWDVTRAKLDGVSASY